MADTIWCYVYPHVTLIKSKRKVWIVFQIGIKVLEVADHDFAIRLLKLNMAVKNNIYMGNFRSTEQGENFKSSETWLYLFKIMKKTQKPIFSAIYANVQKLF